MLFDISLSLSLLQSHVVSVVVWNCVTVYVLCAMCWLGDIRRGAWVWWWSSILPLWVEQYGPPCVCSLSLAPNFGQCTLTCDLEVILHSFCCLQPLLFLFFVSIPFQKYFAMCYPALRIGGNPPFFCCLQTPIVPSSIFHVKSCDLPFSLPYVAVYLCISLFKFRNGPSLLDIASILRRSNHWGGCRNNTSMDLSYPSANASIPR